MFIRRRRPGFTLIEILLAIVIAGIVAGTFILVLISSVENRIRHENVSIVEEKGLTLLHTLSRRIRAAERVVYPGAQTNGSYIVLQTPSDSTSPTIIGTTNGRVISVENILVEQLSSPDVGIVTLRVTNTSTRPDRQSIVLWLSVERRAGDPQRTVYKRSFQTAIALFPRDRTTGNSCGCPLPVCTVPETITWRTCDSSGCSSTINTTSLECN